MVTVVARVITCGKLTQVRNAGTELGSNTMARHSRGVMLRNRAAGRSYWRDEVSADGDKRHLHHRVRQLERAELRKLVAEATSDQDH